MRFGYSLVAILAGSLLASCTDTSGLSASTSRQPAGNPNGVVTVVEYSDLECPACRSVHLSLVSSLMEKYGSMVRFEFRHFPLTYHTNALVAAMAAECAADQGAFWEYLHIAYENQFQLSNAALHDWAGMLDLDVPLFTRCLKSNIKKDTVLADFQEGRERGVPGTPTFFVGEERVPTAELDQAIEQAINKRMQRL
ncbi:MAG: thioredoxin domain-containing protein [Candidatus Peribacteraceae bacterium]